MTDSITSTGVVRDMTHSNLLTVGVHTLDIMRTTAERWASTRTSTASKKRLAVLQAHASALEQAVTQSSDASLTTWSANLLSVFNSHPTIEADLTSMIKSPSTRQQVERLLTQMRALAARLCDHTRKQVAN